MSHSKNVPSINVVTSEPPAIEAPPQTASLTLSPVSPSSGPGHSRSPSDPSALEDAPPSPTLSASSVHFKTTTDLRGRTPGDGISSLQSVQQHGRKKSTTSFQTVTEPDHTNASAATSFTTAPPTDKAPMGRGDGSDALPTVTHINPLDDNTDPTPFAFKPYALAALLDPKTLEDLNTMGGLEGICTGLGTNPTRGLSAHSLGQGARDGEKSGGEGAFAASLSDRQRVYGTNSLPTRPSKSLPQFMWLAFKDKVLVCQHHSCNHCLLIFPLDSTECCRCNFLGPWHLSRCRRGARTRTLQRRPELALRTPACRLRGRCRHHHCHHHCRSSRFPQRLAKRATIPRAQREEG